MDQTPEKYICVVCQLTFSEEKEPGTKLPVMGGSLCKGCGDAFHQLIEFRRRRARRFRTGQGNRPGFRGLFGG